MGPSPERTLRNRTWEPPGRPAAGNIAVPPQRGPTAKCAKVRPHGGHRIGEYTKRNMRAIRINTAVGKQKNKSQTTLNNGSDKPSDRCVRSFNR